jgi:hypothetical protein
MASKVEYRGSITNTSISYMSKIDEGTAWNKVKLRTPITDPLNGKLLSILTIKFSGARRDRRARLIL